MPRKKNPANAPLTKVSLEDLKKLLVLISEDYPFVSFRYRLVGEMWRPNFMGVIRVVDDGVLLRDETRNRNVFLPHLKMIMQFELDGSVHFYEPNFHYDVQPGQRQQDG